MKAGLFNPEKIRSVLESGLTEIFNPPAYVSGTQYIAGEYVETNGDVFRAKVDTTDDPNVDVTDWDDQGGIKTVLYDNVESTIPAGGCMRLSIAWDAPSNESLPCIGGGAFRQINGVLTVWAYTAINEGTRAGLLEIMRAREGLMQWGPGGSANQAVGSTEECVRVTNLNGPRNAGPATDIDFYSHVLTATLTAYEHF